MNAATVGGRRADDKEEAGVLIGEGDKLINVVLLNGERLNVRVQNAATAQDLYNIITDHLGLTETIFFGLMIIKDGEHEFLDLNEKLSKLAKFAPHLWKDDVSCNSSLVFTIFFRVKYYVENICLLQQQSTRHLYYLQLRKDVLEGGIFVHEDTALLLASYALQAEVGDYNQTLHGTDYFVPEHYLPQRTIAKMTASYIKKHLPSMHKTHTGLSDAQAEIEYLKEAQKLQEYGIIFNKVSKFKKDKRGGFSLGISVRGLIVYEERGAVKSPTFRHPWQNIKRMAFHRRRFFIEAHGPPETSKMVLYTYSYKKSRYLLKMCTSFYKFQMMMGMKLSSLREYPKDGAVRMNGVVRTDDSDSVAGESYATPSGKSPHESAVIQPSGIGPAIHLNGSACQQGQEDQPVQVSVYPVQLQKVDGSLGLNIIGGIELGGIYVKTMAPEGPASLSGKINIGDRILEINGHSLEGLSRQEAVNILRTAPHVCTMLIESCVAAPATPNGKPAVPGSQSASAFYSPNRQQQMQSMHRQWSQDSQHSSAQAQQFVAREPHQIEDTVVVSTSNIETSKPDPTPDGGTKEQALVHLPEKKNAVRGIVSSFFWGKVSDEDKAGYKSLEKSNSLQEEQQKILILTEGNKIPALQQAIGVSTDPPNSQEDENQPSPQGKNIASDDDLQLLAAGPQITGAQSEDSTVVTIFKRLQSFLFSPSSPKPKYSEESESSCCESDFDSEFSEITSGSFNPADIDAIRDELETLLGGSSRDHLSEDKKEDSKVLEGEGGELDDEQPLISLPQIIVSDKCSLEMKEVKESLEGKENTNEKGCATEEDSVQVAKKTKGTGSQEKALGCATCTDVSCSKVEDRVTLSETSGGEGSNDRKPEGEEGFTEESSGKDFNDDEENKPLMYRTTSVLKIQKETTV